MTIGKSMTLLGGRVTGRVLIRASSVTVDGIEVSGGSAPLQQGTIDADNGSNVVVRNAYVHDALGSCISYSGVTDGLVENSRFTRCQQQGYHMGETVRLVFRGNTINENNAGGAPGCAAGSPNCTNGRIDWGWEAGGGKITYSLDPLFENNTSFGNGGMGLWADLDVLRMTFRGNRVYSNAMDGIHFEISDGALIENNIVYSNGIGRTDGWCWGANILISSSKNAVVRNNTVAWGNRGISVLSQKRGGPTSWGASRGATSWNDTRGNRIEDNTIVTNRSDWGGSNWCQDFRGNLFSSGTSGGSGNDYWIGPPEPTSCRFVWSGCHSTLASFDGTPAEEGGVYLTTAQRDAVLDAAGLPLTP